MTQYKTMPVWLKTVTLLGFAAVIGLLVWLAVTLVTVLPGAFSSLASIASSLQQARPTSAIVVTTGNTIVNSDEGFTVNWTPVNRPGVYTLRYTCTDGVSVDMRYPANNITTIPCDETIKLGSDVTALELIVRSERKRFIDIPYSVGFIPTDQDIAAFATEAVLTVVNVNIPQSQSVASEEPAEEMVEGEVAGIDTSSESNGGVSTVTSPVTPREPAVITTEIYELPSSDPNGFVDLAVKFLAVGRLTDDNRFVRGGVIDQDTRGAFQFEVRNLGTKTSADWTFEATLTSGATFTSKEQDGLLPNEYSVITLGFDTVGETGAQTFGAEIAVTGDRNRNNNTFSWAVNVVE